MKFLTTTLLVLACVCTNAQNDWKEYEEQDINKIAPKGWLKNWLLVQKQGLTGHIDGTGYPFNTGMWKSEIKVQPEGNPFWWPYEQTAYWIDGALRCGYLLNDEELIRKAEDQINYVFSNPTDSGVLGPTHFTDSKWPHVVLFRAVMAKYQVTGDTALLTSMIRHYKVTRDDYTTFFRNNLNIEIMCWLYEKTGDKEMLRLAEETFLNKKQQTGYVPLDRMLSDTIPHKHGVSYIENIKIPIILYMYTGKEEYLDASRNAFKKLDKHHMLIDGVPSSVESLAGNAPHLAHESCNITDYTWSAGYMLIATGEAEWADKIERAVLNAGFGAVDKDFTSHQYYSSPNQVIADYKCSHWDCMHDWYSMNTKQKYAYKASHTPECCSGNINRFAANYMARMWMKDKNNGVVAAMYGSSEITARVGKNSSKVAIKQNTNYPFSEEIEFVMDMEEKIAFPFHFRIPAWAKDASVYLNGKKLEMELKPESFAVIKETFKPGDRIKLVLPMEPKLAVLPFDGIAIERGPLVYSFAVEAKLTKMEEDQGASSVLSSWEMHPKGHWQYALNLQQEELADRIRVIQEPMPDNPWLLETTPVKLKVPAYKLKEWKLFKESLTPAMPGKLEVGEKEVITLVPLGATLLRLTIFPDINKQYSLRQLEKNK